ncbi:MAG: hypothetical protein AAF386_12455, partial [Pseudomonadota bacterium]
MRIISSLVTSTAITLIATSGTADVTAADVWDRLEQSMQLGAGSIMTVGAVTETPGAVAVRDLRMVTKDTSGPEPFEIIVTIPSIDINDTGNGGAEVQYADIIKLEVNGGKNEGVDLDVVQSNVRYIVSGDPDAMNFAMSG